jgi:hypothetical protein
LRFGALARAAPGPVAIWVSPGRAGRWKSLADPLLLLDAPLCRTPEGEVNTTAEARARATGRVTGLLVYFDLTVAPGITLTSAPGSPPGNWNVQVWLDPRGPVVRRGDHLRIAYRHPPGAHGPVVTVAAGRRR